MTTTLETPSPVSSLFEAGETLKETLESMEDAPPLDAPETPSCGPVIAAREALLLQSWDEAEEGIRAEKDHPEHGRPTRMATGHPLDPCYAETRYQQNDEGLASRFLDHLGEYVRYVWDHPDAMRNGLWIVWHPQRGWLIDHLGVVKRLVINHARLLLHPECRGIDAAFARGVASGGCIDALLKIARTKRTIGFAELDRNPFSLGCQNGVFDLMAGVLRPFDIRELVTKRITVAYDPEAIATAVLSCFQGHYDEEDLALLQVFMGTTLNGSVRDRLMLYMQGPSACGKTTLMKATARLMGGYAAQVDVDLFTVDRKGKDIEGELARVAGKRFAFAPECSHKKTLDEARVKWLTGADDTRYRKLYEAASVCPATTKYAIYGNSKPHVDGGRDGALWRRIALVKAKSGAKEEEEKPELQEQACNNQLELQGLLNWMLVGHKKWVDSGMRIILSEKAKATRESYRLEEDSIGDFLEECCDRGPEQKEKQPGLYRAYKEWAEKQGIRFLPSSKSFASIIRDEFEEGKSKGVKVWKGICLINSKRHPDD